MYKVTIASKELWDEVNQVFTYPKGKTIELEHSLLSISKWESKWKKPFMVNFDRQRQEYTYEELIDYIRCMTITSNVDPNAYYSLTKKQVDDIYNYVDEQMTAAWFKDDNTPSNSTRQVTADLVYYWMTIYNIPFECQKWHFSRLMALIKICSIESQPKKKMSQRDILSQYDAINSARLRKYHTKG